MSQPRASAEDSLLPRIEDYLRRRGMSPADVRLDRLAGDASSRVYFRATPTGQASRILVLHADPFTADELPQVVVGRLMDRLGIPIPSVLDAAGDLGLLVVEDLGDETLQSWLAGGHDGDALYRQAVEMIARIQGADAPSESTRLPFSLAFDVAKLGWELDFFRSEFLGAHRGVELDGARHDVLTEELAGVAARLADEPRVLCHRDYHARNLMVRDGGLVVIDFQDARMGPATYDLVSLLRDCYVELPGAVSDRLVRQFLTLVPAQDTADFQARFDVMSIQRHLKALGTFGHQVAIRNRSEFSEPIPRTLAYLRRTLHASAEYGRLLEVLASALPELR